MALNKAQRISLSAISKYQDVPPSYGTCLKQHLPFLLLSTLIFGLGAYLMFLENLLSSVFYMGLLGGIFIYSLFSILLSGVAWPAIVQVIDWKKLDELLNEQSESGD